MDNNTLIELRARFRKEFETHDFCIGEEQIERVFRELLGEPEPVEETHPFAITSKIKADDIAKIYSNSIEKDIKNIFERDDTFFKRLK